MRGIMVVLAALLVTGCAREAETAEQSPAPPPAEPVPLTEFYSNATARDGDDLQLSVRMQGFDTPELNAPHCRNPDAATPEEQDVNVAHAARDALRAMIRDRRVDCTLIGHDEQDERMVAQCSVDGRDIGEQMVFQGWARDWPRYSQGRYADAERAAREAPRGIWGLECPPDLWGNRNYSNP
jgi:endonuclease YncB( thermonuclease family)